MQSSKESKCLLDTSWKLNKDDINKIHKAYKKHPLFTVKGQSDASVNGTNTTKFELNATGDDVAKNFVKEVGAISVLENIKKCSGDSKTESLDNASDKLTKDQQKAQVFVYITKDKQIKKLEVIGEDEKVKFVINAEFSFGQVKIEKPEGATPIQELLGKFMGGELSTPGGLTDQSGTRLFDAISL